MLLSDTPFFGMGSCRKIGIFGQTESLPLGSPVAIGKRYQEEQNRFSFALYAADQSVLTARLSGLYFADKTVLPNEKYLYAVHIPTPDSIARPDTAFVFTGLSEYRELPRPIDLSARWEDKKVLLSWNILYLNYIYNSYIVEKSTDGQHYFPVSENAAVQAADEGVYPEYAYRSDSLPDNRTAWYYRIRGVNAFGETGPPCEPVEGRGCIPMTVAPTITEKEVIDNRHIRLVWSYPDEMNEYITGFRLYRSDKPGGTKEKIYESRKPEERSFIDQSPHLTNYYVLSVYNRETEKFTMSHTYAELIESIPPAPPTGLAGTIDSTGMVRLAWKSNSEKDIDGYRVYRSNRPDFEFLLVGPAVITGNSLTDSVDLHTLNREIYYRIRAIDLRQNQSDFSEILELKRPDVIPPVAPVIQSVEVQKNGLSITWLNSSSADVVRHHIYRKKDGESDFKLIASLDKPTGKQSVYHDKNIQAGETCIYQVPSSPVQQQAPGEITEQIVLKSQQSPGQIRLTWEIKSKKKVERVLIYKATGDEPLRLYRHSTETGFTDIETTTEKTVIYCIRAIYDDGSSSGLSNEAVVKM